jgi:hypothetical protein
MDVPASLLQIDFNPRGLACGPVRPAARPIVSVLIIFTPYHIQTNGVNLNKVKKRENLINISVI